MIASQFGSRTMQPFPMSQSSPMFQMVQPAQISQNFSNSPVAEDPAIDAVQPDPPTATARRKIKVKRNSQLL